MTWFVVDVESDGPCPGLFSMVSFGVVRVDRTLETTFYGRTAPLLGASFDPEALAVSSTTREQHLAYPDPAGVMQEFSSWVRGVSTGRPIFVSDNPAFDWQWVNWYFWKFCGANPMGFSARRIGDIYAGMKGQVGAASEWKKILRKTEHTHHPVMDAKGNAEAILAMVDMGLVGVPGVR